MEAERIAAAKKTLSTVRKTLTDLIASIDSINAKITALEDLGVLQGKEYWREGKYLTIIEPMHNGSRTRHYIGSKPAKVQDALDSVDRWKKRRQLIQDRETVQGRLLAIVQRIEGLLSKGPFYQW